MAEEAKSAVTLEVPMELLRTEKKVYRSPIAEGDCAR